MSTLSETSDGQLLDLLRQRGSMSIAELATETSVTATAVRQRLTRLMGQDLVERKLVERAGRGRPSHRYLLTEKARRQAGGNFADLALVLWDEIRAIQDPLVRQGLLKRLAGALVRLYEGQVRGSTMAGRMESLKELFADRRVPFEVDEKGKLPVLNVLECPYPELASKDRGICAVEKMLFAELLNAPVRLSQWRFNGHSCCQFETN